MVLKTFNYDRFGVPVFCSTDGRERSEPEIRASTSPNGGYIAVT